MSKLIVRFLAILGALWLIGMVIVLVAVIGAKGKVPSKTILEANFEQTFWKTCPTRRRPQFAADRTATDAARCRGRHRSRSQ